MFDGRSALTAREFRQLIDRETDTIELKTGAGSAPLQDSMVAFSNTKGGTIIIGVDDGRNVLGRKLHQGTDDRVREAARTAHALGRFSVRQVDVEGTPVVFVEVNRRQEGYAQTSNGRILVREGGHNVHLYGDDLWRFLSARRFGRFERVSSELPLTAVDPEVLREVSNGFGWDASDPSLTDRLRERGLVDGDQLTIAGALVLTHPQRSMNLKRLRSRLDAIPTRGRTTTGGSSSTVHLRTKLRALPSSSRMSLGLILWSQEYTDTSCPSCHRWFYARRSPTRSLIARTSTTAWAS